MAHRIRIAFLILIGVAPFAGSAAVAAPGSAAALLASQGATRASAVSAPEIDAPTSAAAAADQPITIQATATDPNAGDLLTISATGYPGALTLSHAPGASPATATLSGTLGDGDVGTFLIEWSVADGTGGTATTTTSLTVTPNSAPTITALASVNGAEGLLMDFAVTVNDPDGDPINALAATGLPSGATFTVNAVRSTGQFLWTPATGQAGTYSVTFSTNSGSPSRGASATSTSERSRS